MKTIGIVGGIGSESTIDYYRSFLAISRERGLADETRDGVIGVLDRLRHSESIDGVVLGGTELPLLLRGVDYPLPLLDTTRIHVEAVMTAAA